MAEERELWAVYRSEIDSLSAIGQSLQYWPLIGWRIIEAVECGTCFYVLELNQQELIFRSVRSAELSGDLLPMDASRKVTISPLLLVKCL